MTKEQLQNEEWLKGWTIKQLIGSGGFGNVYEIEKEEYGVSMHSALKVVTIPGNQSEVEEAMSEGMDEKSVKDYFRGYVDEFANECAIMTQLRGNSHIVSFEDYKILEHSEDVGWDILIRMELLTPLLRYMETHTLEREEILDLGISVCDALETCRKKNIIHRDIKPANIFVSSEGNYKLGDFGISRIIDRTQGASTRIGTMDYMAPEVKNGTQYDETVDIYSLGLVLYRLFNNNRLPFLPPAPTPITPKQRDDANIKRMTGLTLPKPSNADDAVFSVIQRACSYKPSERYHDATEMKKDLQSVKELQGEEITERKTEVIPRCKNCGSDFELVNKHAARCSKCGKLYIISAIGIYSEISREDLYQKAVTYSVSGKTTDAEMVMDYFEVLEDYKDSKAQKEQVENKQIKKEDYKQNQIENAEKRKKAAKRRKKIGITIAVIIASFLILCLALLIVLGILGRKRVADYKQAVNLYNEKYYEESLELFEKHKNYKDSGEYIAIINNIIADCEKKYQKGFSAYQSCEYEVAIEEFSQIPNYSDAEEYLTKSYQGILDRALAYAGEKDYETAYIELDKVKDYQPLSEKYISAQETIDKLAETDKRDNIAKYLEQATKLSEQGDYSAALAALDTVEGMYGTDNQIEEKRIAIYILKVNEDMTDCQEANDLVGAIKAYQGTEKKVQNNPEILEKYNNIKQLYISSTLDEIDNSLHSEGVDSALQVVSEGLRVLPNEKVLVDKKTELDSYKPEKFDMYDYSFAGAYFEKIEGPGEGTDVNGASVPDVYTIFWTNEYEGSLTYKNPGYDKLTGKLYIPYTQRKQNVGTDLTSSFIVLGDGKQIGSKVIANNTSGPVSFSFDITGVSVIEFRFESDLKVYNFNIWTNDWEYLNLSDICLSKSY